MSTKQRLFAAGAGALILVALALLLFRSDSAAQADLVVEPERGPFRVTVTTTGELRAQNSTEIRGPRGAQRARLYEMKIQKLVPEGTVVEQGAFVAQLDRSDLTGRMKDVEIELQKAQSQHEQARLDTSLTLSEARDQQVDLRYAMEEAKLRKEQSAYEAPSVKRQAQIDFEKAERAYEQALRNYETKVQQGRAKMNEVGAELSKARNEMSDLEALAGEFTIKAPQNGMVVYHRSRRGGRLEEGGTINAWDPVVATLPDLSTMESVTYVNEVDVQKIEEGQPVEIGLDANPDKALSGTVTKVANIGEQRPNSDAKVFEVTVRVAAPDSTLRPAMTTSNTVIVAEREDALHVPLEAIHTQDSISYVFARSGGGLVRQQVALGLLNENRAIVERGLSGEERLLLSTPADTAGLAWNRLAPDAPAPDEDALPTPASSEDAPADEPVATRQ